MNRFKPAALLPFTLLLYALLTPYGSAGASPTLLTASVGDSLEATAAAADTSAKSALRSRYRELTALSAEYDSREQQIRTLHESNAQALIAVRKDISAIDQAKVARLTAELASLKQRRQPLFDQYSALNKRISLLKGLKDKTLNAVLKAQAEAMKLLVQAAREEIRGKEAELKGAKETRSRKIAAARKTLAGIESPQASIATKKSVASALNKRLAADYSDFKAAVRKQNAALANQSLASLLSGYKQVAAGKLSIVELEQKIADVIALTAKQVKQS